MSSGEFFCSEKFIIALANFSDNSMLSQLLFSEDDIPEYESANSQGISRSNFYSNKNLSAEEQSLQDAQDILDRANVIAQLGCFHHSMFYEFDLRQGKNPGVDTRTPEDFLELDRRAEIVYGRKIFTNPPEDVETFFKSIRGIPSARQRYQVGFFVLIILTFKFTVCQTRKCFPPRARTIQKTVVF